MNPDSVTIQLSKDKIEEMIFAIIDESDESNFKKTGKNIYLTNDERNIRLTINSYTNRIIIADILRKNEPFNVVDSVFHTFIHPV